MTKEQIGKEIKELIRSIKTHYTFVEEEDRIPLIELELITSKIRKLYEKSIINNYLHSTDESYMKHERLSRFSERANFEKDRSVSFTKKAPLEEQSVQEPVIQSLAVEIPDASPAVPPQPIVVVKDEVSPPKIVSSNGARALKDLKLLIGINDKFLLINNLFTRNDSEYKAAIEHLSGLRELDESHQFLQSLSRQYNWNTESYAFVRLTQIVDKRFK